MAQQMAVLPTMMKCRYVGLIPYQRHILSLVQDGGSNGPRNCGHGTEVNWAYCYCIANDHDRILCSYERVQLLIAVLISMWRTWRSTVLDEFPVTILLEFNKILFFPHSFGDRD
jgi:hypothetical protein